MRNGIRIDIKKDKENGTYSVMAYFGNDSFVCKAIDKEDAERCRNSAKELLDKIRLSKLKATLTDVEITNISYQKFPMLDKGIFEDMLRDLLRGNFVKTAKYVRDKFLEINLKYMHNEEETD
jgi:hypothetical protein